MRFWPRGYRPEDSLNGTGPPARQCSGRRTVPAETGPRKGSTHPPIGIPASSFRPSCHTPEQPHGSATWRAGGRQEGVGHCLARHRANPSLRAAAPTDVVAGAEMAGHGPP